MPPEYDADPRYAVYTLRTECPRCGAHLPANGPLLEVACADCETSVKVPGGLLRDLAETVEDRWPFSELGDTVTVGDLTWRWTATSATGARCVGCGATVEDDGTCACGVTTARYPAPDALRDATPSARVVYGTHPDEPTPAGESAAPVAMTCPQCGAGLTVTSVWQRMSPCYHCGVSVHLPDAVWRQLHPPHTVLPWTVRFEGEGRAARRARLAMEERAEEERREAAKLEKKRDRDRARSAQEKKEKEEREAHAERKAAAAAAAKRGWQLRTLPMVALAWLGLLPALGALLVATLWFVFGTPTVLLGRVAPNVLAAAPRFVVLGALVVACMGWAVTVLATAGRSRQPLSSLLFLSAFQLLVSSLPMVGWAFAGWFAIQYARGLEPLVDDKMKRVPPEVRPPGAVYLLALSAYAYIVLAAVLGLSLSGLWQRFLE